VVVVSIGRSGPTAAASSIMVLVMVVSIDVISDGGSGMTATASRAMRVASSVCCDFDQVNYLLACERMSATACVDLVSVGGSRGDVRGCSVEDRSISES
jgi:hypothetical protein